jgi:imidazole glycerol-phosphate synthase subunit HisF
MLLPRIIPVLLLRNESLVKTVQFNKFTYVGDPCNTVRIFNELEVDELAFLDITASRERRSPNLALLADIANECFMPLSYGGAICSLKDAKAVLSLGFEKIILNSSALHNPALISNIATHFGSQAVIIAIDTKIDWLGNHKVYDHAVKKMTRLTPLDWAIQAEKLGAGEIMLTSIDREGTWRGLDLDLTSSIVSAVNIPVIAHGGAANLTDISHAIKSAKASAVGVGSMVVFQKKNYGVLVNFPNQIDVERALR